VLSTVPDVVVAVVKTPAEKEYAPDSTVAGLMLKALGVSASVVVAEKVPFVPVVVEPVWSSNRPNVPDI
jgi:hypothetical protein